jgi:hypothetical protein
MEVGMTHYTYWLRGAEFVDLARMSIESVRRVDPEAKIHVWTDDAQHTPRPKDVAYHTLPPGRPAMVANLDAQVAALHYLERGDRVLFLDADTLLRRRFPWNLHTDLYVTWRGDVNGDREMATLQPYNYGVVGAHVNARTIEAFLWLRARILQMNVRNQGWYGNQLALAELVGAAPESGQADKEVRIRWSLTDSGTALKVSQLPCETFNYSPDQVGEDVTGKAILHLKGNRKDLMQHYAEVA